VHHGSRCIRCIPVRKTERINRQNAKQSVNLAA
jgi:hypothetical protein